MQPLRATTLIAALAISACSGAAVPQPGPATALPTAAPLATAAPSTTAAPRATNSPATTAEPPIASRSQSTEGDLEGVLLFARFTEQMHTFDGMFTSAADGSDENEVPLPYTEGDGALSRSGNEIAVATLLADGRIGTAIIGLDGTVLRTLEIPDPDLNLPCGGWSPDDSRLTCGGWYGENPAGGPTYTIRSSDGGDIELLTNPPPGFSDLPGDFSVDGLYVFKRTEGYEENDGPLMLLRPDGGEPQPLSTRLFGDPGRFSPDGQSILTSVGGRIVIVDLNGKVVHEIREVDAFLFGPAWSPDGTRIVFSRATGGPHADLYTSRPDGTDRRQITSTPDNEIDVEWGRRPE